MTILRPLLNRSLIALLILSGTAMAEEICPKEFPVLVKDKKDNYHFESKNLEDLFCTNSFEGENFKIVHSTQEEAISFDHEDKSLIKKAANVYYHLTLARNFWIKEIKSDYVSKLPQITIRLDITNAFSNLRHFKNAEQEKNYNNAWSIPEGETPRFAKNHKKWFKEIWFSPAKKIEQRKEVESTGENPIHQSLLLLKDPVVDYNSSALIYQGLGLMATPTIIDSTVTGLALRRLGTIAIIFGLVETTKHMDKFFMDKYYFIDTAMVPDIIYHEFAHIAMSDTMKTVHSVPVIEGMADYFASRVANRSKIYEEIEDYSNNKSKDANNKSMYYPYLEGSWNATSDFTLSLLWAGRTQFEKVNEKRSKNGQAIVVNYDDLVYRTHFHLNENSDISNDLTKALINSCKENCSDLRAGVNSLNIAFEKKGLN